MPCIFCKRFERCLRQCGPCRARALGQASPGSPPGARQPKFDLMIDCPATGWRIWKIYTTAVHSPAQTPHSAACKIQSLVCERDQTSSTIAKGISRNLTASCKKKDFITFHSDNVGKFMMCWSAWTVRSFRGAYNIFLT